MAKLNIPHDAFVFVGDGRKALFLRNEGDEKFLNLTAVRLTPRRVLERTDLAGACCRKWAVSI